MTKTAFRKARVTMSTVVVHGEQLVPHTAYHYTVITQTLDTSHMTIGKVGEIRRSEPIFTHWEQTLRRARTPRPSCAGVEL